ncbi:Uncharacterised protein [Mycobacterium tuberculosis]|nr:Uncharacterised protein [Mycobacterium tuberculosis]CKT23122.1 Uncharacterised protein [Mycobacterium tuberculosis]CKT81178.1 Uncharacterised protein [Mycobacterium tuberculosis]CKU88357.1 Uncharacterised protein [Mycobacterium tuberculosis]CNM62607.1 Uncharacterised protein [Mycobacterium tuberculosis]
MLGHPAGQISQIAGGEPGQRGGPFGCLGNPIIQAQQVALEAFVAGAIPAKERAIGQRLGGQHVCQPEHDRHIGARHRRKPATSIVERTGDRGDVVT